VALKGPVAARTAAGPSLWPSAATSPGPRLDRGARSVQPCPRVKEVHESGRTQVAVLMAATIALLVAAVAVRGVRATLPPLPEDESSAAARVVEPMQLLKRGGVRRLNDLGAAVDPQQRKAFARSAHAVFVLRGCPPVLEWLTGAEGQLFERTGEALRRGGAGDRLAAAAMLVQLARVTEWEPGLRLGPEHAEKLGGLLQEWLRVCAEPSVSDPTLHEPALAAMLLYGRVMRAAYDAPTFGRNQAPYERARVFVRDLLGTQAAEQTAFGKALKASFPRAFNEVLAGDDFLIGCEEEARLMFPEIDGDCGS
jgi:hypothetical protein